MSFQYDPPEPPEVVARWQADLETVVPRTDRVSWLKIIWQSGFPYEPVQRWELYEMHPASQWGWVPDGIREALQGPNPRSVGVWYTGTDGVERWVSDSLVSLVQWQLYQETGCYAHRYWIIQGDRGGHRWQWNPAERDYLQGLDPDLPAPGSLPYAPYDTRVKAQIVRADRLRQWREALAWDARGAVPGRAAQFVDAHKHALRREHRRVMMEWLDEQVSAAVDGVSRTTLATLAEAPVTETDYRVASEQLTPALLEE